MQRPYFYRDGHGKLQKYLYCSFCGAGPFTQEQSHQGHCFVQGSGNQNIVTCRSCDFDKFPNRERPTVDLSISSKVPEPINLSPSGVVEGQVWKDRDKRRDRTITISRVNGSSAYYMGGSKGQTEIRINLERLKSRFSLV